MNGLMRFGGWSLEFGVGFILFSSEPAERSIFEAGAG